MYAKDIMEALDTLGRTSWELEQLYIENEGEVTEETEALEAEKKAVEELLNGEGIDVLGRWLKGKEDELKTYKAEKEAASRRIKSVENTIDYIKSTIRRVMDATGCEKAKGIYYSFTAYTSEKSTVNNEEIDRVYHDVVEAAMREAGLPDWLEVNIKTTATAIKEAGGEALDFLTTTTADAVRFTKPRGGKE